MASIRDVAKRAGVSPTAVSRFLNKDASLSITSETQKRIEKAVSELNYDKNGKVRKIKNSSVGILTVVSEEEEIDDPYFRSIRLGIIQEAKAQRIAANRIYRLTEKIEWDALEGLGCIIIVGHMGEELLDEVYKRNSNLLIVDDPYAPKKYESIFIDLRSATKDHLDRLHKNGHSEIAFIGGYRRTYNTDGSYQTESNDVRADEYRLWMEQKGLTPRIYLGGWGPLAGMELTETMLADGMPTAVVVASDPMAVGVYRALQKKEINIPSDISVVSFDDIEVAGYLTPPLTSVNLETTEIGRMALRMAQEKILGKRSIPIRVKVPAEIILRESE